MRYSYPSALVATLLGLLASCTTIRQHGPIGFWSRNRFHPDDDKRHGPWREYFDAASQHPANAGRYRHGLPVGQWRYYAPSGELEREERFARRPPGQLTIRYYHPNGQVAKRGQARYRISDTDVRFFWFGEWKCYDTAGQPLPSEFYRNGRKTATLMTTPFGDTLAAP